VLVSVPLRTVAIFAVRTWGPPLVLRWIERVAEENERIAAELGHEPTPQEFSEYLRRQLEAKQSPRRGHDAAA
jgi:hypothetical protein